MSLKKIVVVVNDEIITQGEVNRLLYPVYLQYREMYGDQELNEKLNEARREIVEKLVNDKLLLSEARRKKVEVADEEVEAKLDEVRRRFRSEKEFEIAISISFSTA